jgi:signal transduction histidine kinase
MLNFFKKPVNSEFENASFSRQEVEAINQLTQNVTSTLDLDELLQKSTNEIVDVLRLHGCILFLVNEENKDLVFTKTISQSRQSRMALHLLKTDSFLDRLKVSINEKENLVVDTIINSKVNFSNSLAKFTTGVLDKKLVTTIQKLTFTGSCLSVPISYKERNIGALLLTKSNKEDDFDRELPIIKIYASQIGIALANAELYKKQHQQLEDLEARNKQLQLINEFTNKIMATLDVDEIAQNALDNIPQTLGFLGALYNTVDIEKRKIRLTAYTKTKISEAAFRMMPKDPFDYEINLDDPETKDHLYSRVYTEGKIIITDSFLELTKGVAPDIVGKQVAKYLGVKSMVTLPIRSKNEIIGIIAYIIATKSPSELTEFDLDTMSIISNQIGIALDNASLYNKAKVALEQLEIANQELEEKYQYEKDMMGIMGHELRTPMTVAKGMSELLIAKVNKNEYDSAYFHDKIHKVHDSILKESDLIQTMLSASHVDNSKLNLQIMPVDLIEVIEYGMSAFKKDAETKGLILTFEKLTEDIPHVMSDPNRAQEIINNLISNAVKYTDKGVVKVSITNEEENVVVNVQDTGYGIPVEEMNNLGKKFYRIHQHLDQYKDIVRAGGTGLGLYVVKGVLKALGGELRVESVVDKGSTFSAVFPKSDKHQENVILTEKPVDESDMFEKMGFKSVKEVHGS